MAGATAEVEVAKELADLPVNLGHTNHTRLDRKAVLFFHNCRGVPMLKILTMTHGPIPGLRHPELEVRLL